MNALHEYNMDSMDFTSELSEPKTKTVPAVIFKEGDLILYREYIRYTVDYTENPPKETFDFSGRIIIERIASTKDDCTTIDKVFEGVMQE